MGEVLNLRMMRKKLARQQAERKAAANRLAHGVSKPERTIESRRQAKLRRDLDGHHLETRDE